MFESVCIIGFGLIGASIAHNVRFHDIAPEIICCDQDEAVGQTVLNLGLADRFSKNYDCVKECDFIILCVPVGAMDEVMQSIAPHLKKGTIVTDVGSVKQSVIRSAQHYLPDDVYFIAGHPMAGTEFSGPEAGFKELFEGHKWLLTPTDETPPSIIEKLQKFCQTMGATVHRMDAAIHDKILAMTSHLPQLISYMVMNAANELEQDINHDTITYSANGFHGFARIAISDPVMWRDVYRHNKGEMIEILDRFQAHVDTMRQAILDDDTDKMQAYFTASRDRRLRHLAEKEK